MKMKAEGCSDKKKLNYNFLFKNLISISVPSSVSVNALQKFCIHCLGFTSVLCISTTLRWALKIVVLHCFGISLYHNVAFIIS
jgi:hypothetical protein